MSYHYTREPGSDGEILTEDGDAGGIRLSELLPKGAPVPIGVALELVAYVADILTIGEEDGAIHGGLGPNVVTIDESGAVSVEGYGVAGRAVFAPESRVEGISTDTYGLGLILLSLLSEAPVGKAPPETTAHDDAMVEAILGLDFQGLESRPWFDQVRHFLCGTLAHEPGERPEPLDVANVFAEVASQCDGPTIASWASGTLAKHNEPKLRVVGPQPSPPPEEELAAPQAISHPGGGTRTTARSRGESTAMWSREKIAALLTMDDVEEPPVIARSPTIPSPSGSSAPKPAPMVPPPQPVTSPDTLPPPPPVRPSPAPFSQPGRRTAPTPQPSQVGGHPAPSKSSPVMPILIGFVLMTVLCGGVLVAGGGAYWWYAGAELPAMPATPEPTPALGAEPDRADGRPSPVPEDGLSEDDMDAAPPTTAGEAKPVVPAPRSTPPSSSPKPAASTPSSSEPKAEPVAAPADGFKVSFVVQGTRARLDCQDGQSREFVGTSRFRFPEQTSCNVSIGGAAATVSISESARFVCGTDGISVTCQ